MDDSVDMKFNAENPDGDTVIEDIHTLKCSFLHIPTEVFLHICSFLDARFVTHSLSLVCKHFHCILSDNSTWKARIGKRWNSMYPALPVDSEQFNWRMACTLLEDEFSRWSLKDETMTRVVWKDVHYATVDAVLLMNSGSLCVTGSRDRSLATWNVGVEGTAPTSAGTVVPGAHDGWIWRLASCDHTLYSCSWDNTVKSWAMQDRLQEVSVFRCQSSVLALACSQTLVAAGLYTRKVVLIDPRSGDKSYTSYSAHQRCVLALAMGNGYIVSASEDQTLAVWDMRAAKIFKKIYLSEGMEDSTGSLMCLSLKDDILYVGDIKGQIHVLNPTCGLFEVVETFPLGHSGKLTAVQHGPGFLMTSSTDGTLRVFSPTRTPQPITVIMPELGEVTGFDYKNNILAMGGTDCAVEIWMPKTTCGG